MTTIPKISPGTQPAPTGPLTADEALVKLTESARSVMWKTNVSDHWNKSEYLRTLWGWFVYMFSTTTDVPAHLETIAKLNEKIADVAKLLAQTTSGSVDRKVRYSPADDRIAECTDVKLESANKELYRLLKERCVQLDVNVLHKEFITYVVALFDKGITKVAEAKYSPTVNSNGPFTSPLKIEINFNNIKALVTADMVDTYARQELSVLVKEGQEAVRTFAKRIHAFNNKKTELDIRVDIHAKIKGHHAATEDQKKAIANEIKMYGNTYSAPSNEIRKKITLELKAKQEICKRRVKELGWLDKGELKTAGDNLNAVVKQVGKAEENLLQAYKDAKKEVDDVFKDGFSNEQLAEIVIPSGFPELKAAQNQYRADLKLYDEAQHLLQDLDDELLETKRKLGEVEDNLKPENIKVSVQTEIDARFNFLDFIRSPPRDFIRSPSSR